MAMVVSDKTGAAFQQLRPAIRDIPNLDDNFRAGVEAAIKSTGGQVADTPDEMLSFLSGRSMRFPVTYGELAEAHTNFARAYATWEGLRESCPQIAQRLFAIEKQVSEFCTMTPPSMLEGSEAVKRIDALSPAQQRNCICHITSGLREAGLMKSLDERGIGFALENGLEKVAYGSAVLWAPNTTLLGRIGRALNRNANAFYLPTIDVTVMLKDKPTDHEILNDLARSGTLPEAIGTLAHEQTHDMQHTKCSRLISLACTMAVGLTCRLLIPGAGGAVLASTLLKIKPFSKLRGETLITEMDAHTASAAEPLSSHTSMDDKDEIFLRMVGPYKTPKKLLEAIPVAHYLITDLRLFGVSDQKISNQLTFEAYDSKRKTYPKLEKLLRETLDNSGIVDDEGYAMTRQVLQAGERLQHLLGRAIAHRLAHQALQNPNL